MMTSMLSLVEAPNIVGHIQYHMQLKKDSMDFYIFLSLQVDFKAKYQRRGVVWSPREAPESLGPGSDSPPRTPQSEGVVHGKEEGEEEEEGEGDGKGRKSENDEKSPSDLECLI